MTVTGYCGIVNQQEIHTNFDEQTGLETQSSSESYALDKLRFARHYSNTVGVFLLLFVVFLLKKQNSL